MNHHLHRRRRLESRGQAMTELAMILPLLLLVLLGIFSISELVGVQDTATTATRNGARLGAELGNGGWTKSSTTNDPSGVDQKIVATVETALSGASAPAGLTVVEIDVYQPDPGQAPGYFSTSDPAMLLDRYNPDGTPLSGWTAQYTLDQRNDVLGTESQVGVRVVYTYKPSTSLFAWLNSQRSAYTVMQVQPA